MAKLLLVVPEQARSMPDPAQFTLLSHMITRASDSDNVLLMSADAELVLVDARSDLVSARSIGKFFAASGVSIPVLLMLTDAALPLVNRDWGVNDFVLESAPPAELEARIRFLMAGATVAKSTIVSGPVTIDEDAYTVSVEGRNLDLTYTEFELLKYMALHPGRVLTREHLLSEVWGYDYYGGTRTVDVHIRRLRAKLGPEHDSCIGTVRNVGYRFTAG
jgi:DNA-binding response OmpR family regulator